MSNKKAAHEERRMRRPGATLVVGLTGGIATGKSTIVKWFRELGVPVDDADAAVHKMYAPGGAAVALLVARFGEAILTAEGGVDRRQLSKIVFGDAAELRELESIVHPLVRAGREAFVAAQTRSGAAVVVLDIPLLFEFDLARECHLVATTSVDVQMQRRRVLARPAFKAEPDGGRAKCDAILQEQVTDTLRTHYADVIFDTGADPAQTKRAVENFIFDCRTCVDQERHLERALRPFLPGLALLAALVALAALVLRNRR